MDDSPISFTVTLTRGEVEALHRVVLTSKMVRHTDRGMISSPDIDPDARRAAKTINDAFNERVNESAIEAVAGSDD